MYKNSYLDETELHMDRAYKPVMGGNVNDSFPPPQHRQDQLRLVPTEAVNITSANVLGQQYRHTLLAYSSLLSSGIHPMFKLRNLKKMLSDFISMHIAPPLSGVEYSY
jgi:hypothetical protein